MRARLKFIEKTKFNFGDGRLAMPADGDDVPKTMSLWTMCFQSEAEVGALEFEGDVKWLARFVMPGGELRPGFRFKLFDGPTRVIAEGTVL